ncbi:MAG: hypothetical protein IKA17_00465 [Clostridia bacterium]|nr:hypothetical protein [Clostridia bacterium]
MKKFIFALVFTLLFATAASASTQVYIDSVAVPFNDSTGYPFVENGRTLVPLRATMEAFGAEVKWDGAQQTAVVSKGVTTVTCKINEAAIYRNGTKIENDAPAQIRNGRTYLPIRIVLEALGAQVEWNGNVVVTSGPAGNLVYSILNSGSHVSNVWKRWSEALNLKSSGNYSGAIAAFTKLAPDFIEENSAYTAQASNAMLFKHLGECYASLGQNEHAAACFKYEASIWEKLGKNEETIDANRRSSLINSYVQMYAKTLNPELKPRKDFGEMYEPANGIYIGAYAEGDSNIHNPYNPNMFYMDTFPQLVGKDMAGYLLYLPSTTPLSNYQSHIEKAKQKNKIIQIALEPASLYTITPNSSEYIQLAQDMENSGCKFFLRFASEMNDTSCPWYTEDYNLYIEKFRIVANIFHQYAPSVAVVWSPNFYPSNNIEKYYPGDEYVDYVGISSYMNHQPETDPLGQNIDRNRWSAQLDTIHSLYGYKKPIIISEGAASYMDFKTYADITDFASRQIYDYYTYLPIKYPSVKAVFLYANDVSNYRFSLTKNNTYLNAYKNGIAPDQFLSSPDEYAYLHQYYELGTNVRVEPQPTEICSYVKTPANDISYVIYSIYGTDVATSYGIPFSVNIDFTYYRGTTVPLTAKAYDSNYKLVAEETYYLKVMN